MRIANVGAMRERVEIYSQAQTVDAAGSITTAWTSVATTWARMTPTGASGITLAERDDAVRYYTMMIRYMTDIGTNSRIIWRDRKFDVTGVVDETEQRQFLTVYLREINS